MPLRTAKIIYILLLLTTAFRSQNKEIERLMRSEFKMTYPSVHFKHNSADFAAMPYSADSCFKFIARHIEDINSLVIWRDSSETEELSKLRIKKLRKGIRKYTRWHGKRIKSMKTAQKISQLTIYKDTDSNQVQYLLSLNSVFDVSAVIIPPPGKKSHAEKPRWWCRWCWERGAFTTKFKAWRKRNIA
ncbi:MAG: hypothetical protein IAF38_15885 [Bacteroidia bacterium]|nr:hypothetical protein [Bacteroidia bacterium]